MRNADVAGRDSGFTPNRRSVFRGFSALETRSGRQPWIMTRQIVKPLPTPKGQILLPNLYVRRLVGRRTRAVRQFSLCGWETASSQGRQAHWRGKLAASDRSFSAPPMNRDKVVEFGASIKLPFNRIDDFARRSQIRWHTQVACPCFSVLFATRIQPVRLAQ
jgi:hypothetical protein